MAGEQLSALAQLKLMTVLYDFHALRFPESEVHRGARYIRPEESLIDSAPVGRTLPENLLTKPYVSARQKGALVLRHAGGVLKQYPDRKVTDTPYGFMLRHTERLWVQEPGISEDLLDDMDNPMTARAILPGREVVTAMYWACHEGEPERCETLEGFIRQLAADRQLASAIS